jgi:hypothetical protein
VPHCAHVLVHCHTAADMDRRRTEIKSPPNAWRIHAKFR